MISIIIPNYNRAELIGYTIESLQNQTLAEWECIIVDDGSTDKSENIICDYISGDSRISFFKRPENLPKGANSCRNFGLSKARGEFIKWVDSDDLLEPNCLEWQVGILRSNKEIQVCFGYGRFFNDKTGTQENEWSRNRLSKNLLYDHIVNEIRWPIGGLLWRANFFADPPFNARLKNSQEWLMHSIALAKLKPTQYANLPEIVYLIRRGNLRMSSVRSSQYYFNQAKSRYLLVLKILTLGNSSPKVYFQLLKQVLIFIFHGLKA